jgi:hypothetical protein
LKANSAYSGIPDKQAKSQNSARPQRRQRLFQSGQLNRWSAAEVSDLSVVTLLNGPQEIPTLPDHPFDRNTPFFKFEQHYSLYSISLIQSSRWKTEPSGQLIVVPAKTPDGHTDRSNGRPGFV